MIGPGCRNEKEADGLKGQAAQYYQSGFYPVVHEADGINDDETDERLQGVEDANLGIRESKSFLKKNSDEEAAYGSDKRECQYQVKGRFVVYF